MLTGDENIADVKFRVIWQIDPMKPEDFAFNIRNPQETVKAVAESAMREIVGRTQIQRILTAERKIIEPTAQELMQKVLNDYRAGVLVLQLEYEPWSSTAGVTIWSKFLLDFMLSRHAHPIAWGRKKKAADESASGSGK